VRALGVILVLILLAFVPVSVAYAEPAVPETTSIAEVEGPVDDWKASIPVHAGFMWNEEREEWTQYVNLAPISYESVTLEVGIEVNPNEKDGPGGWLVALTYDVGNLKEFGVGVHWAEYFGVNVGPFARNDFETGEWQYGVLFSVVDLSPIE